MLCTPTNPETIHQMSWYCQLIHQQGETCHHTPFPRSIQKGQTGWHLPDFPLSLMTVGKVANINSLFIFMKSGVEVYNESDVLIMCWGKILIEVQDDHSCYLIPLVQHHRQRQPCKPSNKARHALQQVHSMCDLPSRELSIQLMHTICGYQVKSSWLNSVKDENFFGWTIIMVTNINKYYPETDKTLKGHLNQTQKFFDPQRPWLLHLNKATLVHSKARKNSTSLSKSTTLMKPSSLTKQYNLRLVPKQATNKSWSWWK